MRHNDAVSNDAQGTGTSLRDFAGMTTALRSRLADDPNDEAARRELVTLYRGAGHLDQAGRYGIAIDGLATQKELRAYGTMLRGIGADDDRMRGLSRLPEGATISVPAREALESPPDRDDVLDALLLIAWALVPLAIVVTLVWTFVVALTGAPDVQSVAVIASLTTLGTVVLGAIVTALWAMKERLWRAAVIWAAVAGVLLVTLVLLVPSDQLEA